MNDWEEFPWFQGLDGLWHMRAPGPWRKGVGADALCGRDVASVHRSEFNPKMFSPRNHLCRQCTAVARADAAESIV